MAEPKYTEMYPIGKSALNQTVAGTLPITVVDKLSMRKTMRYCILCVYTCRWQKTAGDKATPKALKKALVDMKLMAIVHKYFAAT